MGAEIASLIETATDEMYPEIVREQAAHELVERLPTWTGDWLTLTPDQRRRLLGIVEVAEA